MAMKKNDTDPRVIRTRKLLQDAFDSLLQEKDFESITVRDIAERATVNRATFYAHFVDKYEILEARLMDSFMTIIDSRICNHEVLNDDMIRRMFLGICEFHESLNTICRRRSESLVSVFEIQIKEKIQSILLSFIPKPDFSIKTAATILTWGIYGAAYVWNKEGRQLNAEDFVNLTMPLVMNGAKALFPLQGAIGGASSV